MGLVGNVPACTDFMWRFMTERLQKAFWQVGQNTSRMSAKRKRKAEQCLSTPPSQINIYPHSLNFNIFQVNIEIETTTYSRGDFWCDSLARRPWSRPFHKCYRGNVACLLEERQVIISLNKLMSVLLTVASYCITYQHASYQCAVWGPFRTQNASCSKRIRGLEGPLKQQWWLRSQLQRRLQATGMGESLGHIGEN